MSNARNFENPQTSVSKPETTDNAFELPDVTVVDGAVVDEDGDVLLSDEDTCSEADIEEAVGAFMLGDITLAQLEGISADEIYAIADLGYDLFEEGKLEDAQKIFEGLNSYNPMDAYFHNVLGSISQKKQEWEQAVGYFNAASQLYSEDVSTWTNLGECLFQWAAALSETGESERAAQAVESAVTSLGRAIELDPEVKSGSALRARALVSAISGVVESAHRAS